MNEEIIRKNMVKCRKSEGLSRKALAADMKVKEHQIAGVESGHMRLTLEWIDKYLQIFPDLEIDFGNQVLNKKVGLTYGTDNIEHIAKLYQGLISTGEYQQPSPDKFAHLINTWHMASEVMDIDKEFIAQELELKPTSDLKNNNHSVPIYDVYASAGHGSLVESEKQKGLLSLSVNYLYQLGVSRKDVAIIFVAGDSMEPTLSANDPILIDMSINNITADGVYVLRIANAVHVKRIQSNIDGSINVMSDNNIYKSFNVSVSKVKIIAKVILEFRMV